MDIQNTCIHIYLRLRKKKSCGSLATNDNLKQQFSCLGEKPFTINSKTKQKQ